MTSERFFRSGIDIKKYVNDILKELFRKTIHICTAFVPLLLKYFKLPIQILLGCVIVIYCICEKLRLSGKTVPVISAITQAAARKRDENKFVLGPVTLAIGVLLTSIFFERVPAAIGILSLAFGDGLASLAGKLFGNVYIPFTKGKTVVGSLTCFTAIFVVTFLLVENCFCALIIAFCGMLIELLPLKDFDNFFIPLILAAIAQFLFPQII